MARGRRRRFGHVRKLPSGRHQASYLDPDGERRYADETYETQREAEDWLTLRESELLRGEWRDPDRDRETLREFGNRWIKERSGLRPRTVDLYRWLFGKYLVDQLGNVALGDLDAAKVRTWRQGLLDSGVSATMTAKAYRLLRAILMTAVDDGVLTRNPCRIRGAGSEPTPERPALTVAQVFELAAKVPPRYRVLVLVATFGSLRWSEVIALRRRDVSVRTGVIRVERALVERSTGEISSGAPKSRAGRRAVALPQPVMELLREHLKDVDLDADALVFTGDKGGPLRRSNFNRQAKWPENVAAIGVPGLHFHDLRHTGNTLAAESGASLRDLMARMGHDSMQAAVIYQHRVRGADRRIAAAMNELINRKDDEADSDDPDDDPDDGTAGVLTPAR
jgi:integrase